jgi:hypothetical protein
VDVGTETTSIPTIELGGVRVSIMLTCVMPPSPQGVQVLPPSVGALPIVEARRFPKAVKAFGNQDDLLTVLPAGSAFWLSIASGLPYRLGSGGRYALIVGANGVNTITGQPFKPELEKDSFYAVPGQQYIDGANRGDRTVGQFIAQPLGLGDGLGEQLYGNDQFGGLDFVVFRKPGVDITAVLGRLDTGPDVGAYSYGSAFDRSDVMRSPTFGGSHAVGMGSSMRQTTVKGAIDGFDPNGERHVGRVHILDPDFFRDITGQSVLFPPISPRELVAAGATFYVVNDGHLPDIGADLELGALVQSTAERAEAAGDVTDPDLTEPLVIPASQIRTIAPQGAAKEIGF